MTTSGQCPSCGATVHRSPGISSGVGENPAVMYEHDECPGAEAPEDATGCGAKLRRLVREDGTVGEWVEDQR